MLEINININREISLVNIQAVRTKPKKTPKPNQMCTYHIIFMEEHVDTLKFTYNSGIELAIAILQKYNKQYYSLIALNKKGERIKNAKKKTIKS